VQVDGAVRMDDGGSRSSPAPHSAQRRRRALKGGIRYHPEADHDEGPGPRDDHDVEDGAHDIPFVARKAASPRPPRAFQVELERLTRRFTQRIAIVLGPYRDIPAPDVNTNAQVMAWILDEYSSRRGNSPAVVTGKPIALGGSLGREEATGARRDVRDAGIRGDFGIPVKGRRVVIQRLRQRRQPPGASPQ